ncbi:AMP-binding protein [Actinopolymorpha sp. NPDC004070]|uniref:AMP-binding protein n=1 Tax=Actinopolymorpha sp. NPDC004070 TaxID=3154548 RepID=UPI0033B994BC
MAPRTQLQPDRVVTAVNVADLVRRAAQDAPDHLALVAGDDRLTWAELDRAVDAVAAAWSGAGLVAGFRVALAMSNSLEFVTAYFGALRAGVIAVPLNPAGTAQEIGAMLGAVNARVVLADDTSVAAVRAAVDEAAGARGLAFDADVPVVVPVGVASRPGERSYDELLAAASSAPAVPPADPEALAVLLFTSGAAGPPVMLTHRALLANLDQLASIDPPVMTSTDVVLGVLPMCHVYGLNAVLGMVARVAGTLVLVRRFTPEGSLDLVAAEQVTNVPAVPTVFASWLRSTADDAELARRLASVRLLVSGAAPLPPSLQGALLAATGLVVQEGYGLTEAGPVVTSTLCSAPAVSETAESAETAESGESAEPAGEATSRAVPTGRAKHTVGAPLPGVELRIVDETGAEVEVGETGQVLVRGPNLFSGYWPDGADAPEEKGWLATGDIGYLDEDGDLVLVDRIKELVIVSGFNVYPREVEEAIGELDGVAEVAVVAMPDPQTGEAVRAYVVPAAGAQVSAEEVRRHCEVRLARFKRPSVVEIVPELPRSVTGKVAKSRLRRAARESAIGF